MANAMRFWNATKTFYIDLVVPEPVANSTITLPAGTKTLAGLASPAFTGTPTAPTVAGTDNSTAIATTAHVKTAYASTDGTIGGVVKMRISGSTLYIRSDGVNA